MAEFCIAEFALAIGRSTDGGRAVVAAAVELKYRLPRVWAGCSPVTSRPGGPAGSRRPRSLLSQEAAAFVDAQVAPFAHRIGIAALERLIAEAVGRFMPDKAAEDAHKAADARHFSIDHQQVSFDGTSQVTGELDLADALDLDTAVARARKSCWRWVDRLPRRRRSIAAGQIARNQLALDLASETDDGAGPRVVAESDAASQSNHAAPKPRQVVLHVHLSETAITEDSGSVELARVENHHRILTADQVRTWCANPDTEVIVKPVIDLDEHIHVNGYEVPDRLREQVTLRDHTACSRGAPGLPARWTPTTSSPTPKAAPPRATTSPRCVDDTIA